MIEAAAGRATLHLGGERYRLEGHLAEDWIAALAAFLDCGFAPHDALVLALAWRDGDEKTAVDAWPCELSRFPRVAGLPPAPSKPFASCPDSLGLYPVLPTAEWVERVVGFGVKTVQFRRKSAAPDELSREIARSVAAGRAHDAQVFINDHWQAAVDAGAYGVHLGQEDVHTADLHAIAAAGVRLGLSTHGYFEILTALHFRPSYIALGAVFATTTKVMPTAPQGLARLARYVRLLDGRRAACRDRRNQRRRAGGRARNGRAQRGAGARRHRGRRPRRGRSRAAASVCAAIVRLGKGAVRITAAFPRWPYNSPSV